LSKLRKRPWIDLTASAASGMVLDALDYANSLFA
jgi:hypothetical protein